MPLRPILACNFAKSDSFTQLFHYDAQQYICSKLIIKVLKTTWSLSYMYKVPFLVAPLRLRSATQVVRLLCVRLYVCVCWNFFPTNPYLQAGLTNLDEIWHDGRS